MGTAQEAKARNVEKMGQELGEQYSELWQEIAYLHIKWGEYVELYGTKPSRIALLNRAAPSFFGMVEREMWGNILLHLARLTDSSKSIGKNNLTLKNLPALVSDEGLKLKLTTLLDEADMRTRFCRDWRNRTLAHRDLALALNGHSVSLENGSRKDVSEALDVLVKVLNEVSRFYLESENYFRATSSIGGASALLYVIDDGLEVARKREERRVSRKFTDDDFKARDI